VTAPHYVTIWGVVGVCLGMAAYPVAWFWGGRPERFAAAVMLLHFAVAAMSYAYQWEFHGLHLPRIIDDYVRLLIFGWFCLRANRWWPFLMTAAMALAAMVDVVAFLDPSVSRWDAATAKIGLGYVLDLTLLLSVFERMVAGEPPAVRAAWVRADMATAARRNRRSRRSRPRLPA
jgi:hypothetical protein